MADTLTKRALIDRRSGEDMRQVYNLDYFLNGGDERRRGKERRRGRERRSGWVRVSGWCSVYVGRLLSGQFARE
jgi:hypothetical protein